MNETIKALIQAGGAIGALGFVWLIVKALTPIISRKNGHQQERIRTAGEQNVDFWKAEIRKSVMDGVEAEFKSRDEQIRRIMREEIARFDTGQERIIAEIRRLTK